MIHETHDLYTIDDFNESELKTNMLAKLVVQNHAMICKKCGEQNKTFLKFDCGLIMKVHRAMGQDRTQADIRHAVLQLQTAFNTKPLTAEDFKSLQQKLEEITDE